MMGRLRQCLVHAANGCSVLFGIFVRPWRHLGLEAIIAYACARVPTSQGLAGQVDEIRNGRAPRGGAAGPPALVILYPAFADVEMVGELLLRPTHPVAKFDEIMRRHGAMVAPGQGPPPGAMVAPLPDCAVLK
jgi:hypothetical protein